MRCEESVISYENPESDNLAGTSYVGEDESVIYGELVLLGYSGCPESCRSSSHGQKHRSKLVLRRRTKANGIEKAISSHLAVPPSQIQAVRDCSRHVVSYSYHNTHTVLVEYSLDPSKDMFQVGRSSEDQIDFTVVDTWLAAGGKMCRIDDKQSNSDKDNSRLFRPVVEKQGNESVGVRPLSSTISRYACRILINRDEPHRAFLYAAGFDGSRNIFLGEKATKWIKPDGEIDGLTTNGILILHPNCWREKEEAPVENGNKELFKWREVSVDGDIYGLRAMRSSTQCGEFVASETNELEDGTLIDLCGATLLWRTAEGLEKSPSKEELERRLDEINAGKPQCPVNFNTLIIPKRKCTPANSSRQPYAYLACGHVQGKHQWGMNNMDNQTFYTCPMCRLDSTKVIQLVMGLESAFHLDSDALDHAFNPCGHVASLSTVRYWSRIPLPHGTNSFHPVCPFCTAMLSMDKPYVRLIFQDHCS